MPYEMPVTGDMLIWDIWMSQHQLPALTVADEIGLFTALAGEPKTTEELAAELGLNSFALGIHLSMLASMGLAERRLGRWRATEVTRTYLLPESPIYWGPVFASYPSGLPAHAQLREALKRGTIAGAERPVNAWESGQLGIEQARNIAAFMHAHSLPAAVGAARSGAFEGVRRLLDVGGGSGCFAIAIAQRYPELHASVMDLSAMCEAAQDYIDAGEVDGRVDTVAVDMFREPWPTGYDALFFSNIFHDWHPDTCTELAAKAFAVLPPGGRIYLHEQLMSDNQDGPLTSASFSVLMLLGTRGKQYSLPEFQTILEGAGFTAVEARHSCGYYSLVSARKP